MLDVKKTLSKMLNWFGFRFDWSEYATNNTSDTWVPVFTGGKIQHRVIPTDANITATKSGSYYTSGSINVKRRGNCVTVELNGLAFVKTTSRVTIATIPSGFRPLNTMYGPFTDMANYFLVNTNGNIQVNAMNAGTKWGTISYCV